MVELRTDRECARAEARFKEGAVRVIVDCDQCEGNAVCLGIAPDIFDLDDEDYAVVKTDPIPPTRSSWPNRRSPNAPALRYCAATSV